MRRGTLILMVILVALAAGVVWYLARGSAGPADGSRAGEAPGAGGAAAGTGAGGAGARGTGALKVTRSPAERAEARAKRDALREQIARQLASRPVKRDAGSGSAATPRPPTDPQRGNLRNNLGAGRDALVAHINEELMPLASECIEQAQARSPQLSGMLAIGLETIADEGLGAVVDAADPTPANTVIDPLLLECIRESALSLTIPPPLTSGREKFELTLPVGPQPGSGAPR